MATSSSDDLSKALARVAELEAALQISEANAKTANEELRNFVYAASHDLLTPLRTMNTYAQLLERLYANDSQASELTGFLLSGVASMKNLLEGLLLYSRIKPAPILSNVPLSAAVQSVLFKLAPAIQKSGAAVRFADLPVLTAHETQVCQLMEQILLNSILYRGKEKPQIEISADEGELDGDTAYIVRIKDNGCGIEEEYLSQVLQPFKRLHGPEYPGSGLGLAICHKIMRAHRGKLWIESDGVTGSAIFAAFPI